jgi:fucose permease
VGAVFHSKVVLLTGLVFLLYGPLEWMLSAWATTFLTGLGMSERLSALALSGFWLSFLASRLLVALLMAHEWIAPGIAEAWLIVGLALLAGVTIGNMAGVQTAYQAAVALVLTGFCLGPIFPTLVGILFRFVPEERGTAFGAMYSLGSLGGILLPPIMGAYAARRTFRAAWRIPMIMALLMGLVAVVLVTEWSTFVN